MKWTIGIITGGGKEDSVRAQIRSIRVAATYAGLTTDDYEIIVVGGEPSILGATADSPDKRISFDEGQKPAWITRKKNIIAQHAKHENLVLMHDYVAFDREWFLGWEKFNTDLITYSNYPSWDVGMNVIANQDGSRFRDWMLWLGNYETGQIEFLDYSVADRTHEMYVSGSYMCVNTNYMRKNPLDENRSWGEGEDVEWSLRLRDKWSYKFNPYSRVSFLKAKPCYPNSPGPV